MIIRQALLTYLHNLLACESIKDYAPNGLQVEGVDTIARICTAVTASAEVIDMAATLKADALLVHHGFFWKGEDPVIKGIKRYRISTLLQHQINLLAYHLPLDCHAELGNNACLAKRLSVQDVNRHPAGDIANLLWSGVLSKPQSPADFKQQLQQVLQREPLLIEGSDRLITRVAWCSGGAHDFIEEAERLGVDAYISGEVAERTYYQAKELGIHYFACGHHATERYGIQALGEHLSEQFDLEHYFIDSENPV